MAPLPASEPPHERHPEFVAALTVGHGALLVYLRGLLGRRQDAEDVL